MATPAREITGIRLLAHDGAAGYSARLVALSPGEGHPEGRSVPLADRHAEALRVLLAEILAEQQAGGD
jgi:hypothetical protein